MEYLNLYDNLQRRLNEIITLQNTNDQEVLFRISLYCQVFFIILQQIDRQYASFFNNKNETIYKDGRSDRFKSEAVADVTAL